MKSLFPITLEALCLVLLFGCVSLPKPTETSNLAPKTRYETFQSRKMGVKSDYVEVDNTSVPIPAEAVPPTEIQTDAQPQTIEVETAPLTETENISPAPQEIPEEPITPPSVLAEPASVEPTEPTSVQPTEPQSSPDSTSSNEQILEYRKAIAEEKQKSESLEALVKALTAKATELQVRVNDQEAVMTLLNNEISTLKASQQGPKATPARLNTFATLKAKVEEQDGDIKNLNEEVTTMKTLLAQEIEKTASGEKKLGQ